MLLNLLLLLLLSGIVTYLILRLLFPLLRHNFMDSPNLRSSHFSPTPRGGGLAFLLVSVFAACLAALISDHHTDALIRLVWITLPLAFVGFLDDSFGLPIFLRYFTQVLTSILIILLSPLVIVSFHSLPLLMLLIIAVTAVINFTNFMDGLDGLVAGCMAVSISAAAFQVSAPWSIWTLVGALLGFLFWNWCPAKVFMGDIGSTFLGAVFSGLILQASTWTISIGLLLVATPLLADAFICVLRRLMDGQRVFDAHRLHLFQRLNQAGWSHARVSYIYILATAILAFGFFCGGLPLVLILSVLELFIGVWLDQCVAVSFEVAS